MTQEQDKNQDGRKKFLKATREQILENLGLPAGTPAKDVETLLKTRDILKKLNDISAKYDRTKKQDGS